MDALAGAGVPHDISLVASSLRDGDWLEAGLHGLGGALGAVGAWSDPVAALTSAGVGWALEHVGPLRDMLDDLAGDQEAVMADSARLQEAAGEVVAATRDVRAATARHLAGSEGLAVMACAEFGDRAAGDCAGFALLLRAGADAMRLASGVVAGVRSLVRDALAELVGMATSSALAALATAGTGVPALVARVAWRARQLTAHLSSTMAALARSIEALRGLLVRAESVLESLVRTLRLSRPIRVSTGPGLVGEWAHGLQRRIEDVRPRLEALHTVPGAGAVIAAGPEE